MGSQLSRQKIDNEDDQPEFISKAFNKVQNNIPFSESYSNQYPTQDSVVNSVIEQFTKRSNVGLEKYGTTLDRTDLTMLDWVQHAQEELMDGILYLEKIKKIMQESKQRYR
jgi:hypothetical protein